VAAVLLGAGALVVLTSAMGLFGINHQQPEFLSTYAVAMLFLIVSEVAVWLFLYQSFVFVQFYVLETALATLLLVLCECVALAFVYTFLSVLTHEHSFLRGAGNGNNHNRRRSSSESLFLLNDDSSRRTRSSFSYA
jgi:hypothetical protein